MPQTRSYAWTISLVTISTHVLDHCLSNVLLWVYGIFSYSLDGWSWYSSISLRRARKRTLRSSTFTIAGQTCIQHSAISPFIWPFMHALIQSLSFLGKYETEWTAAGIVIKPKGCEWVPWNTKRKYNKYHKAKYSCWWHIYTWKFGGTLFHLYVICLSELYYYLS